jgi:hypothetical protein
MPEAVLWRLLRQAWRFSIVGRGRVPGRLPAALIDELHDPVARDTEDLSGLVSRQSVGMPWGVPLKGKLLDVGQLQTVLGAAHSFGEHASAHEAGDGQFADTEDLGSLAAADALNGATRVLVHASSVEVGTVLRGAANQMLWRTPASPQRVRKTFKSAHRLSTVETSIRPGQRRYGTSSQRLPAMRGEFELYYDI